MALYSLQPFYENFRNELFSQMYSGLLFLEYVIRTYTKLKPGQYLALDLGNVVEQYTSVMGQNFNLPPTIRVPSGTGISLLFMSDIIFPQPTADASYRPLKRSPSSFC